MKAVNENLRLFYSSRLFKTFLTFHKRGYNCNIYLTLWILVYSKLTVLHHLPENQEFTSRGKCNDRYGTPERQSQ